MRYPNARAPFVLYHQVRLMVATLVAVGAGDPMTPADVLAPREAWRVFRAADGAGASTWRAVHDGTARAAWPRPRRGLRQTGDDDAFSFLFLFFCSYKTITIQ